MPADLTMGSLFSGVGGLDLAVEWSFLGARTAWQLDQVGGAVRRRHWPDALQVEADVRTVDPRDLPAVDVLCGGFPCQDLSVASKGAGLDGARSGLYREVLRCAGVIRPRFVVVENVPPLLKHMARLCEDFHQRGYGLSWAVCEAADAGAPHLRRRVFVLAELGRPGRGLVEADKSGRWQPETVERMWPTLKSTDARSPGAFEGRQGSDGLAPAARMWPTMTGGDAKASGSRCLPGSGASAGMSLTDAIRHDRATRDDVRPWATPRANPGGSGRRGGARSHEEMLSAQVRAWTTITTRDHKTGELPNRVGTEALSARAGAPALDQYGRRLNPAWCERLMGYPEGWTLPHNPQLHPERHPLQVRGRYPADWDRSIPWPGYEWEPSRTLPDGPPCPGRPAQIMALGNAVVPQQGALALEALLAPPVAVRQATLEFGLPHARGNLVPQAWEPGVAR